MKKCVLVILAALLLPYMVTLAWTGRIQGEDEILTLPSGRYIVIQQNGLEKKVDAEEYLIPLVAAQIPADYGCEALRAQAIIARTYVYKKMGSRTEIGEEELEIEDWEGGQMNGEIYEAAEEAVRSTGGKTIPYEGNYIDPLFHRASAGRTRMGTQEYPYLQPVECPKDVEAEEYLTVSVWTKQQFADKLNQWAQEKFVSPDHLPQTIQIIKRDDAGYVEQAQIGTRTLTGEEIRQALELPSSCFALEEYEGGIRSICQGIGHGYGLSQYTAKLMAQEGKTGEEILSCFYKNIVVNSE